MTENKDTASYYTMADAATVKGISYHTVSRAVRGGKIAVHRIGRQVLISRADLEAWSPMLQRRPNQFKVNPPRRNENVSPTFVGEVRS